MRRATATPCCSPAVLPVSRSPVALQLCLTAAQAQRSRGRADWDAGPDVRATLHFPNAANWLEILELHLRCLACLNDGRAEEAYVAMEGTVLAFTKVRSLHPLLLRRMPRGLAKSTLCSSHS